MRLVNRVAGWRPLALLLIAGAIAGAAPALAQDDLVVKKPVDRRFPQGQFCALPVDIEFTSPATSVRVVFEARVFVLDPNDNQLHWTEQYIDNVVVTDATTYDAHLALPPSGSNSEFCYLDLPVPFFYFNDAGFTMQLKELFDTDPAARGWDLANGGSFAGSWSAPRQPESTSEGTPTGGSMALGQDSASPTGTEIASTEITVNGLTPGQNFNVSAWWDVNYVIFGSTETFLTVSVFAPNGTPVARKSWGGLKRAYR